MNARLDQPMGAGWRAPLMRVRFQIDIKRTAARPGSGLLQRKDLGVLQALVGIGSCAGNIAARIGDYGADIRIRRG